MNVSRQNVFVGLKAGKWVTLFKMEEKTGGVTHRYHNVSLRATAHIDNTDDTFIAVQESADGSTWTTRYQSSAIKPGGSVDINTYHVQPYLRVVAFNNATGRVDGVLLQPELQSSPGQWPVQSEVGLTWCEVSCETGQEVDDENE